MATLARALYEEVVTAKNSKIRYEKAHSGGPWKELSDVAAEAAAAADDLAWNLGTNSHQLKVTNELRWQRLLRVP